MPAPRLGTQLATAIRKNVEELSSWTHSSGHGQRQVVPPVAGPAPTGAAIAGPMLFLVGVALNPGESARYDTFIADTNYKEPCQVGQLPRIQHADTEESAL